MQARRQQIFRRMKMTEKDKQKNKINCVLILSACLQQRLLQAA